MIWALWATSLFRRFSYIEISLPSYLMLCQTQQPWVTSSNSSNHIFYFSLITVLMIVILQPDFNCYAFTSCMFTLSCTAILTTALKIFDSFGRIIFQRLNILFPSGSTEWNKSKMASLARGLLSLSSGQEHWEQVKCISSLFPSPHRYDLTSYNIKISNYYIFLIILFVESVSFVRVHFSLPSPNL